MIRAASVLALALLLAPAASAQETAQPTLGPNGTVALDFRDAELTTVINFISELTKKNFLYDETVRGRVTLVSPTEVTLDEAYRVFEAILQVKGFTTVPGPGGVLKIVAVRQAKESPIETVPGEQDVPNRDLFITRLIPLGFVKAEAISNTLRPLVSKDASMVAYAPTNTIILTDTASNVRRLLTIIDEVDVETYREQIKVIPVEYADARTLTDHLREIFGGTQTPAPRRARTRVPRQQAGQAAGSESFGEAGQARFIADDRTNSIIVIATRGTLAQIEHLLQLLDYRRKGSGRIHVVRLQNADAEEISQTLASLAEGGGGAQPAQAVGGLAEAGALVADLGEGTRITADAPTNSLIVQGTAESFASIKEVIEVLDTRRPQVMVEALIMEVNVTDSEALGAGFLWRNILGGDPEKQIAIGSSPGAAQGFATDAGADFTGAILGQRITVIGADGVAQEVPVIQGIITASAQNDDSNIVSAPVILTADNEEAQIVVGQNIPIATSQVATPSASGDNPFDVAQSVERQDVGVTLRVTPQISEGENVRLEIYQEISQVLATAEDEGANLNPTTTKRTVENVVYVADGEAVMIGGILQDIEVDNVSKVPWLGDIPFLGWAFKTRSTEVRKINLIIVLTPHIVRDPDDLKRLTVENRERFRDAAGDVLEFSEAEQEQRRKALAAGVPLPVDRRRVRRELEKLDERYPVESLPELRQQHEDRERERLRQIAELQESEGGEYRVQVQLFSDPDAAMALLEQLLKAGYDGTILSRRQGGDLLHGVELGPFPNESRAQHVAREVTANLGFQTRVLLEP